MVNPPPSSGYHQLVKLLALVFMGWLISWVMLFLFLIVVQDRYCPQCGKSPTTYVETSPCR